MSTTLAHKYVIPDAPCNHKWTNIATPWQDIYDKRCHKCGLLQVMTLPNEFKSKLKTGYLLTKLALK